MAEKKIKFYILERVAAHKQGRRSEYHRLVERGYFSSEEEATEYAKKTYGERASVQKANEGYDEGK